MVKSIITWILEIGMVPLKKKFANSFRHINPIMIMDKDYTFERIVLTIESRIIDIGPEVGT